MKDFIGAIQHSISGIQIYWFDLFTVAMLICGIVRGRKRGMSMELLPVFQALLIVALASQYYEPLGRWLADKTGFFSYLSCYIGFYVGIAIFIQFIFSNVKRWVGDKIVGSDLFGGGEYYLGMLGGMLRYACVLIMMLAILNAPLITATRAQEATKKQTENIGISFGSFAGVQQDVFWKSYTGVFVHKELPMLLIRPTIPENKPIKLREGNGKKLEKEIDKMLDESQPKK